MADSNASTDRTVHALGRPFVLKGSYSVTGLLSVKFRVVAPPSGFIGINLNQRRRTLNDRGWKRVSGRGSGDCCSGSSSVKHSDGGQLGVSRGSGTQASGLRTEFSFNDRYEL